MLVVLPLLFVLVTIVNAENKFTDCTTETAYEVCKSLECCGSLTMTIGSGMDEIIATRENICVIEINSD